MSENDNFTQATPPPQPSPATTIATSTQDERTWAMIGHLAAFTAFISGIGCVVGPLIVWLVKRDTLPFAGEQALEALNFNITVVLAAVALWIFMPCGLLYSALLVASLSGGALQGAASMALFAIGSGLSLGLAPGALGRLQALGNRLRKDAIDTRKALRGLPPLIRGYLRLGAGIGDGAVIDPQFGTTDVLIVLPVSSINARYFAHFGAPNARQAA